MKRAQAPALINSTHVQMKEGRQRGRREAGKMGYGVTGALRRQFFFLVKEDTAAERASKIWGIM